MNVLPVGSTRRMALKALRSPLARALTRPLVTPRTLDDYLALLGPLWSLDEVRARITGVVHEAPNVTSLLLEPSANWRPSVAGQHVMLTVDIDGVRRTRSFSLSRAPGLGSPLRVTIKAHAHGCISVWARDRAKVGDVIRLSPAQGDFVLPTPVPSKLLFVSGGSGITPLVAMGQQLVRDGYQGDLCWIHCERQDIPLEADLLAVIRALEHASLYVHRDTKRRLDSDQLKARVPDWAEREAFVCGPSGLMQSVDAGYRSEGRVGQVHREEYQPPVVAAPTQGENDASVGRLAFVRSGREAIADPGATLLVQAERAGLFPAYGCRQGICHTCKCKKLEGVVRNALTGETHGEPDQEIQLCIHSPLGNVSLDL